MSDLSLEKSFAIQSFATQVKQLSEEQTKEFLVKLYGQMIVRENIYSQLLKHEWSSSNIDGLS